MRGGARVGAGRKPGPTSEVLELIQAITPVKVGRNNYTRLDRYRDFSRVLHGTPEGRRVMAQIIDLLEGPLLTEADLSNHALLAARALARFSGQRILTWASVPPPEEGKAIKGDE